jgi:hypothetical protein
MGRLDSTIADLVTGAHCPLTEWVFAVVEALQAEAGGRRVVRVDRFEPLTFLADARTIVLTHYPGSQIVDAVERGEMRVVHVAETPGRVVHFLMERLGLPIMEAIRAQTASAVCNLAIGRSSGTLVVARDLERPVSEVVRLIATHLKFDVTAEACVAIAARLTPAEGRGGRFPDLLADVAPERATSAEPSAGQLFSACDAIMEPLLAMARGDSIRPVVWPAQVFKYVDRPDEPAPPSVSAAGPSRNIFYGPYLYLPPAEYRVELLLEFSEEISDVPFGIDMHGGGWLARARIDKRPGGGFRGYFFMRHVIPTSTVEVRLRNEWPVETGTVSLIELAFFVESPRAASRN